MLGIMFFIDNQTIFVAKENNLSYNLYKPTMEKYKPDIVVADNNASLAQNNDCIAVTYQQVAGSEYSYQREGNIELKYLDKQWIKRGLD